MALIVSAASGNFNAGATWVGGVVPTVGDEARASAGHTVTINVNTTCNEISNAGTGIFTLNGGITLTANVVNKSATGGRHCLQFNDASPAVGFVVGSVTGSGASNGSFGINNASTGTITITGSVIGGNGTGSGAVNNASTGTITITGSVTGGQFSANSFGAQNATTGNITITGNVTGGVSAGNNGVNNSSTGALTITGSVTGTNLPGVNNASSGTLTITGDCTASTSAPAVNSTSATPRVSGSFISASNGRLAVNASAIILLTTPNAARTRYALNGTGTFVDMFTADNTGLAPAVTDVRSGVVYGSATGVLAVPAANSVAFGVPVDNTTGTAVLTLANVQSALTAQGLTSARAGALDNLDTTVSSRLAPSGTLATVTTLANAPTVPTPSEIASQVRSELSVELGRVDQSISSRLASASYTAPTTPPTAAQIATAVEGSLLNEADGQAVLNAIVGAIGNTNLSEVSLVAAVRADLERTGGKLDNIPTTSAPSASAVAGAVRTELGVELGRIDASVSSRLAPSGTLATVTNLTNAPASVTPTDIWSHATRTLTSESGPTAVQIRQEIDANSTKLDAAISSRMAASESSKLDAVKAKTDNLPASPAATGDIPSANITAIKAKTDALNTERLANVATTNIVGTLLAQSQS